jgi:hypothetical protein
VLSGRSPPRSQGAQDSRFGGRGGARRITPEGRLVFVLVNRVATAVVAMSGGSYTMASCEERHARWRTMVAACALAAALVLGAAVGDDSFQGIRA